MAIAIYPPGIGILSLGGGVMDPHVTEGVVAPAGDVKTPWERDRRSSDPT